MSYSVRPASAFGRIGEGLGKGLAEQLPKEAERYLKNQGLERFEKESAGLTPLQQMTRLSSIRGITPQEFQSYGELARQQAKGQALRDAYAQQNQTQTPKPSPFPQQTPNTQNKATPSITQEAPLENIQEGFIPRTEDEKMAAAGQKFNANPAIYGNDPQKAIDYEEKVDITNEAINKANLNKHENLSTIQDNVVKRLGTQAERLNVKIPSNVYSDIEDKAIQATKPKKMGGEGLTEQQAMRKYGDELDAVSRDYSKINEIGNWGITGRKPSETLRDIKSIQSSFEKRGDTRNLADTMIAKQKLSPKFAYALAEPVSRVPELNSTLKSLPELEKFSGLGTTLPEVSIPKTLEIAPKLAKILTNNEKASPLAIAYELEKKGYDPQTFLQYLTDHKNELNLKQNQNNQIDTPNNLVGTFNDWWLSSFSGIE